MFFQHLSGSFQDGCLWDSNPPHTSSLPHEEAGHPPTERGRTRNRQQGVPGWGRGWTPAASMTAGERGLPQHLSWCLGHWDAAL